MDTLTVAERSERMRRVRSANTSPELIVRRIAHGLGFRYRLHRKDIPGSPDLALIARRKAIFVHGCFWHRHGERCRLTRMPKSRKAFWKAKFAANVARDRRNQRRLKALGWKYLVVWECQLSDRERLENKLLRFLDG
jgi:DNA mismatch endonuclease, patch repair protein